MKERKCVRNLQPEEDGAAETRCDGRAAALPVPLPLCSWGKEGANVGETLNPGRRESWREGVFNVWVYFSLSYSDLIGNTFH